LLEEVYKHIIGAMDADVLVPKGRTFAAGNGPTPYIAALQGRGASIVSETEDGAALNTGLWKKLTGDDTITARGLNEAPKEFRNTAQIIISTNELPKFDRHDEAVITRMVVIPFLVSHERNADDTKRPEDIKAELTPEYPAVIRLLAEYYIKLKNDLRGIIPISKESEFYKLGYIAEVETDLDKYINACIDFENNSKEVIKRVYESYKDYYEFDETAVKRGEALSQHKFTRLMMKNYKDRIAESVARVGGKPARCFIGLKLKPLDEVADRNEAKTDSAEDLWGSEKAEPAAPPPAAAPAPEPPKEESPCA
jgi:phage/plasmid-associated DNA primase